MEIVKGYYLIFYKNLLEQVINVLSRLYCHQHEGSYQLKMSKSKIAFELDHLIYFKDDEILGKINIENHNDFLDPQFPISYRSNFPLQQEIVQCSFFYMDHIVKEFMCSGINYKNYFCFCLQGHMCLAAFHKLWKADQSDEISPSLSGGLNGSTVPNRYKLLYLVILSDV